MKNKGFALMELVIALTVMGVLGSYSMVLSSGLDSNYLDAAAKRLISDLRYTQQLAMSTGQTHMLLFTSGTSTYTVSRISGEPVNDPVTQQPLSVDLTQFGGVLADFGSFYTKYQPNGSLTISENQLVTLHSRSGAVSSVCVNAVTGAPRLSEPLACGL